MGRWSEKLQSKFLTFIDLKEASKDELHMNLSILSQIVIPLMLPYQVKISPGRSKSFRLHSSKHFLNSSIRLLFLIRPPDFSSTLKTSLKSPPRSQGLPSGSYRLQINSLVCTGFLGRRCKALKFHPRTIFKISFFGDITYFSSMKTQIWKPFVSN